MQTDNQEVTIHLDNGAWLCNCTPATDKRGAPYYLVTITPPHDYPVTTSDAAQPVNFKYITEMMEFNFSRWPFKEDEYRDELESELSAIIVAQISEE